MSLVLVDRKAIATAHDHSVSWVVLDNMTVAELKAKYREVEVLLVESLTGTYYTLRLSNVEPMYFDLEHLLNTVDITAKATPGAPSVQLANSYYLPLFKVANQINISGREQHYDQPIEPSEAMDIMASGFNVKRNNCLFTVNGFYTRAVHGSDLSCLVGGAKLLYRGENTCCGCVVLPDAVEYATFDQTTLNDRGELYIKLVPGTTQLLVIAGRLFIAGVDKEFSIRGDYAVFSFTTGFIVDWVLKYAKHVMPGLDVNSLTVQYLNSLDLRRLILSSDYSFMATVKGTGYWRDTSAVTRFGMREYLATDFSSNAFTGIVTLPSGRVLDYWGVYESVGTVLHHATDDDTRDFRAHTIKYLEEDVIGNCYDSTQDYPTDHCQYHVLYKRVI